MFIELIAQYMSLGMMKL